MSNSESEQEITGSDKLSNLKDIIDFMPYYGWPEWPPKETPMPQDPEWWKQEVKVFPSPTRFGTIGHLHNSVLIEVNTLPQAGWSTIIPCGINPFLDNFCAQKGWLYENPDDPVKTGYAADQHFVIMPFPTSVIDTEDEPLPILLHEEEGSLITLQSRIRKIAERSKRLDNYKFPFPANQRELFIETRGACDDETWYFAQASHKEDSRFSIHPEFLEYAGLCMAWGHIHVSSTDAVIMMGTSQETSQKRRREANKSYPGWITDSPFFGDLSNWYAYWIENVWPNLHRSKGTGLLVVDGERTQEEKVEIITGYIKDVVDALD